jgi:RHS repeat-associated protein
LKRIFTVNDGVIVGEVYSVTSHAQTRSYLEDFLGSVTGEMTTSNVVSNSRRFTPYGRDWLGVPSVAHSPAWIGGHGYHPTGLKWAGYSVFHRVVTPETGQWTTRDPLWPEELAYGYVNGNPTTWTDPSGLSVLFPPPTPGPTRPGPKIPDFGKNCHLNSVAKRACCTKFQKFVSIYCAWCARHPSNDCRWECNRLATTYKQYCNKSQFTPGPYKPGWDVRVPSPKPSCIPRDRIPMPAPRPSGGSPSSPPRYPGIVPGPEGPIDHGPDRPSRRIPAGQGTWPGGIFGDMPLCGAGVCDMIPAEDCYPCCKLRCRDPQEMISCSKVCNSLPSAGSKSW